MKYRIVIITDELRATGYRLAGIDGIYHSNNDRLTRQLVSKFCEDKQIGIILITENILPKDQDFDKQMRRTFPFIVPIPVFEPVDSQLSKINIEELIQRSIGIFVKL